MGTEEARGSLLDKLKAWGAYLVNLDPRSMALFRIVFGLLCFADLASRWSYIQMMYSSAGWYPNGWVISGFGVERAHPLSLLQLLNTTVSIQIFFLIGMLSSLLFILGYRTKLFQVLTGLIMISVHNRNPVLENGGEIIHNLWWMWTIILPLGRRWSVDALTQSLKLPDRNDQDLNRQRRMDTRPYQTLACLAILLNLCLCYFLNGVQKSGQTWLSGNAVALVLEQDRIVTAVGAGLREFAPLWLLKGLTWGTLLIELSVPLFLLSPFLHEWARRSALLVLFMFHVGLGLTLQLGFFSPWMISIYCLLLTPSDWNMIARFFRPHRASIRVFYDSDCGVCHLFARCTARLDYHRMISWVGRGEIDEGLGGLTQDQLTQLRDETIIVALTNDQSRIWLHHQAVAEILKRIPLLSPISFLIRCTGPLGRVAYQNFAVRRAEVSQWLGYGLCGFHPPSTGASDRPENPQVKETWEELPSSGLSQLLEKMKRIGGELYIVFALWAAITTAMHSNQIFANRWKPDYPHWARSFVLYGRFYQNWRLFGPDAPYDDGWMIFEVTLEDGRVLDLRTGLPPDFSAPNYSRRTWGMYESRWGFRLKRDEKLWPMFINWLDRPLPHLRIPADKKINAVQLYWISDETQPPVLGGPRPPIPKGVELIRSWKRPDLKKSPPR